MLMGSLDILISPFVESFLARKPGGSGGGIRGVCLTWGSCFTVRIQNGGNMFDT